MVYKTLSQLGFPLANKERLIKADTNKERKEQ
jgi:hypothetical protein